MDSTRKTSSLHFGISFEITSSSSEREEMKEEIILKYWSKKSPPIVLIMQDGKVKITWNFFYDYHEGKYWAEGRGGRIAPEFRKDCYLGEDKDKALGIFNRLFVQEQRAHKKEYLKEYYE